MSTRGRVLWVARRLAILAAAAALPLLASSCATVDAVTGQNVYNLYSIQDDIQLGQNAMQQNLAQLQEQNVRLNADGERVASLQGMVRRLADAADMPQLPYEVTLIHTQVVNAAAMPGGQMIVFEGLYSGRDALVEGEDELAAVMAHEIAHVNCRHATERLSKIMTGALIAEVGAAVADANDKDDLALAIRALFAVGTAFWIPTYSRKDEYEADRVGMFYMARAGYDPRAAPRIWKRVSEKEGNHDSVSIFATHPSDKNRYNELMRCLPFAMDEYARVTGSYPPDYTPPASLAFDPTTFNWRAPAK